MQPMYTAACSRHVVAPCLHPVPVPRVALLARRLRVAGRLDGPERVVSTGGRGRGGGRQEFLHWPVRAAARRHTGTLGGRRPIPIASASARACGAAHGAPLGNRMHYAARAEAIMCRCCRNYRCRCCCLASSVRPPPIPPRSPPPPHRTAPPPGDRQICFVQQSVTGMWFAGACLIVALAAFMYTLLRLNGRCRRPGGRSSPGGGGGAGRGAGPGAARGKCALAEHGGAGAAAYTTGQQPCRPNA